MNRTEAKERIERLRLEIEDHNRRYYVLNEPVISDFEYDLLINELVTLEKKYPEFDSDNSPTRRIGSDLELKRSSGSMNISTLCFLLVIPTVKRN